MQKYILLFSLTVLLMACKNHAQTQSVSKITSEQLKEVIGKENVQLIDVRTLNEFNNGSIKQALNINVKDIEVFKTEVQKLNKTAPVYVFCQKGGRSNKATKILEKLGFTTIYDYSAGYSEWSDLDK